MREKGFAHIFLLIFLLLGLVAGVYLVTSGNPLKLFSKASESDTQKKIINNLTAELLEKKDKYNNLTKSGQVSVQAQKETLDNLTAVAIRRKEELSKLIEQNPQAFLDTATLSEQKNTFPKQIQAYIEEKSEITGNLQLTHFDDFENKKNRDIFSVDSTEIYIAKGVIDIPARTKLAIKVNGVNLGNKMAVLDSKVSVQIVSKEQLPPVTEIKAVAILVNFQDDSSQPVTQSQVREMLLTADDSVKRFYESNALSPLKVEADVIGWYTIPLNKGTECTFGRWVVEADQIARDNGVNLNQYSNKLYIIPRNSACNGSAWGGMPNQYSFYNGSPASFSIAHELGHNLGLHHANFLNCGSQAIDRYHRCRNEEYGDGMDVMGGSWKLNYFNAPHLLGVGWIPEDKVKSVSVDGIYTIAPLEISTSADQIIKINKKDSEGVNYDDYYISYRQPIGFDQTLPKSITEGVSIHVWNGWSVVQSKLIDTTPGSSGGVDDSALSDGATFTDSINGITIKQLSHDASSATVEIKFINQPTPTPNSPSLGDWQTLNSLPGYSFSQPATIYNGYIFAPLSEESGLTVYSARVNGEGTIDNWQKSTTVTSTGLVDYGIAAASGYLFISGGSVNGYAVPKVYFARVNTDGTLGVWSQLRDLPNSLRYHAMVSDGNYLFVIGGNNGSDYVNSVYSAKINSDGTIANWQTLTSLPQGIQLAPVVALKGSLFVLGGSSRGWALPTIYSVKLDALGNIGGWQTLLDMPLHVGRFDHSAVADDDYIYVLGGLDSSRSPILSVYSTRVALPIVISTPTPQPHTIDIPQGDIAIYFPWLPSNDLKADDIINGFNNQGFRVRAISRWDSTARWITRVPGTPVNNFDIKVGDRYFIKNEGNAGVLNLERLQPTIVESPAKPTLSCTPCLADINKDKNVNMTDYSYWAGCKRLGIQSNPVCKNADLDKDGRVGNTSLKPQDDPEVKCITSQMGKKCS